MKEVVFEIIIESNGDFNVDKKIQIGDLLEIAMKNILDNDFIGYKEIRSDSYTRYRS